MSISHIYPIDERSLRWCIANEFVKTNRKNRFIVTNWVEGMKKYCGGMNETYVEGVGIHYKYSDGGTENKFVSNKDIKTITRRIKLKALTDNSEFFDFESKLKMNDLRFASFKIHQTSYTAPIYKGRREKKELSVNKRRRLAKQNKGCSKSKNK